MSRSIEKQSLPAILFETINEAKSKRCGVILTRGDRLSPNFTFLYKAEKTAQQTAFNLASSTASMKQKG
jgi:hypothetical protein